MRFSSPPLPKYAAPVFLELDRFLVQTVSGSRPFQGVPSISGSRPFQELDQSGEPDRGLAVRILSLVE